MLLWRPAPAGCTISASSPQQQQIWVVVPGEQVSTGGTVSSIKYLPRYQHHIGPSVPGQLSLASLGCELGRILQVVPPLRGWRRLAACCSAEAPHQPRHQPRQSLVRSYSLQSTVYPVYSLQLHRYTRLVASLHTVTNTPAPWWTSAPTRPAPSRRQRTR